MKEPKVSRRTVKGKNIVTVTKEIDDFNIVEVECGCNGYLGGDTGHGSRTYIRFTNLASTDMDIMINRNSGYEGIEIEFGGDAELRTLIKALKFFIKTLKRQIAEYSIMYTELCSDEDEL